MDPDANLKRQLELTREIIARSDSELPSDADEIPALAEELAEHVLALDAWIISGGFKPSRWAR